MYTFRIVLAIFAILSIFISFSFRKKWQNAVKSEEDGTGYKKWYLIFSGIPIAIFAIAAVAAKIG